MALGLGGGNDIRIRFLADTTQVGTAVNEMGSGISKGLGMAGIGWAAAGAAAVTFAKQSVDAAMQSEDAQKHLADAYAKFPALHDASLQSLNALADATLRKTRFDDEAARAAETVLAQYHLTGQQILELLPLVTDFAAKTGKDLPDAASAIGKALLGNTRALKEVGINYKLTGDAATDYHNIVQLLTEQVGGAAAADAETTAGKLAMLTNQYGELKEQLGSALLPLISAIVPVLIQLLQALTPVIQLAADALQWLSDHGLLMTVMFGAAIGPIAFFLDHMDWVKAAVDAAGNALREAGFVLRALFGPAVEWVKNAIHDLGGAITEAAGWVAGVFTGAWNTAKGAIDGVASAVRWLIDRLHDLKNIWNSVGGIISKLGGLVGLSAPAPPSGGSGAPALAPSVYGAARAVSGATATAAGGASVTVNIHGNVGDPALIGRRVVEALATYSRTNGARALRQNLGIAAA